MGANISAHFISSFDSMVKIAYQEEGKLQPYVRVKSGVVGNTHKFFTMGKGIATPRIPRTNIVPMNVSKGSSTATLSDWSAGDYFDILELEKISYDEKKAIAKNVAASIGRRLDQNIIDAMAASANSTQVETSVGGTDTGLNLAKILRAKRLMDGAGIPDDGYRIMVISAYALEQALQETALTSEDYNIIKPLALGQMDKFAGFRFIMIGEREEGGLPKSANVRNNFAFHRDAVGLAIGQNMRVEIDMIPEKKSWLIDGCFAAGAVTIDTDGVYDVLTHES